MAAENENRTAQASLELLYHISRELASALDLQTVLQRVLLLSVQNVKAVNGSIIVMDDHEQPFESLIFAGEKVIKHTTSQLRETLERGLAGWVARQKVGTYVPDTSQDTRWVLRADDRIDQTGPKSAVSAPILVRDKLVGVMTLVHSSPGFFSSEHLALVQAICDQAGIAILNARLYAESERRAQVMAALAESAKTITGSLNLEHVLKGILSQISQALQVEAVTLALVDSETNELEYRASTLNPERIVGVRVALGQGLAGFTAQDGQGKVVPDASREPSAWNRVGRLLGLEPHALACAPIRSEGQIIGILEAINPVEGAFAGDALLVLTGIGSLAGSAIRHAQLFESLRAAHKRYHELFEDSIDSILVTDPKGVVLDANRQAELMTGYPSSDLRQLNLDTLQVLDRSQVGEKFEKLSTGSTLSYETVLFRQSGLEVPVQVYARQVTIDGKPQIQWILRDITERKNLDSLRDDLISMIYHDLRSPLANVVSSLDVLSATLPEDSEPAARSLLNIAQRSTERIQRLTNSLLDISRLEAGQPVLNQQPVEIAALVGDAIESVAPTAANKSQALESDLPAGLPLVLVDGDMIRRVLVNLMENAVKFSTVEGKIITGARREGDFVRFWVADNGPGIPPAEQERIFDKFTRLHAREGPRGLGLGLAYCRLAVLGHGGKIWVESEPGSGSQFNFTLPVAPEH